MGFFESIRITEDIKPLHGCFFVHQVEIIARAIPVSVTFILGCRATQHYSCPMGDLPQCGIQNLTTDIIKINVNAVRANLS